jgi:hypothetical protein
MINPPDARKFRNPANAGKSKDPTYKIWVGIRSRCRETTRRGRSFSYINVKISSDWSEDFNNFVRDMGERPFWRASVDRIDGNKGYCKHNCRWATQYEQCLNRRGIDFSKHVSQGVRLTRTGRYEARVAILGRMFHVGTYGDKETAQKEYKRFYDFIFKPKSRRGNAGTGIE